MLFLLPSCGEKVPNELDAQHFGPYEIATTNGTQRDILDTVRGAVQLLAEARQQSGRPGLLIIDSMTRYWDLLKEMAQNEADRRAAKKNGGIVLMHLGSHPTDGSTLDADALPGIISGARSQGYSFVGLDAAF